MTPLQIILIAEDEDDPSLIQSALDAGWWEPCHLEWVSGYPAGLAALQHGESALALVSLGRSGRPGLELIRTARAQGVCIPLILLAGDGTPDLAGAARQAGATDWLERAEITPSALARSIRYALETRRLAQCEAACDRAGPASIDLTGRGPAEQAFRESQERLKLTTQAAQIGTFYWDFTHDELRFDARSYEVTGISPDSELTYERLVAGIHEEDRESYARGIARVLDDHQDLELEFRVVWPDGSLHWVFAKGQAVFSADGRSGTMFGVLIDITNLRTLQAEKADHLSRIEVQRRLIEQREQERLQIARDLHDGALQHLIGMVFTLDELSQAIGADPQAGQWLARLREDLQKAINEIRSYASDLRPPTLANFGFEKAARAYLSEFRHKHPEVKVTFDAHQEGEMLPEDSRTALYRIYQETLTNIARHSRASQVSIRFEKNPAQASLVVQDNGVGFTLPRNWVELARSRHLGLVGIRERAQAMGGKVEIHSAPGRGTTLRVVIPLAAPCVAEPA